MGGIMDFVGGLFKPAADLIDNVHTSDEERLKLKNAFTELQNALTMKQIELEGNALEVQKRLVEVQAEILVAEAKSESWIVRNWRPVTMLTFVGLIVLRSLGLIEIEAEFAEQFMTLVQIGLGGYVVGRSAEKFLKTKK